MEREGECLWTKLPRELQHRVLSNLPLRSLFQARCVCKDWRYVIHWRGFRAMYDAKYASSAPSPSICYVGSYYPPSLEWSMYCYASKLWMTMRSFPPQLTRVDQYLVDQSVYSVEGLLCLLLWKQEQKVRTHFPFLVWNPLTNKSRSLPPCKHRTVNRGTFFVHAFAAASFKSYKILMAHNPKQHAYQYMESDTALVTELYDSASGSWTELPPHTLRLPLQPSFNQAPKRGMLCDDVIHFVTRTANENVLLSFDIPSSSWREEVTDEECMEIFEWDGRVMTAMPLLGDDFFIDEHGYRISLFERNPETKRWVDTGIEIPFKIRNKFVEDEEGVEIAASGNHLAITGYTRDGSFRIAVYKKEEKFWRFPPSGAFSDKMRQARIEGLFQFKPRLDWVP